MQRPTTQGLNKVTRQPKDNQFRSHKAQYKEFFEYLQTHIATATMAATALNIYRPNVCYYKRWLESSGKLWELYKGKCKVTGYTAAFITCNPDLAPKRPKQTNLFDNVQEDVRNGGK